MWKTFYINLLPLIFQDTFSLILQDTCAGRSSDLGVDRSYGGAPKAGSTGRLGGQASVSRNTRVRVAEEGAASRCRAWRPRTLVTPNSKDGSKKVVSKPHSVRERPRSPSPHAWGVDDAVGCATIKEPLGKRRLVRVTFQGWSACMACE